MTLVVVVLNHMKLKESWILPRTHNLKGKKLVQKIAAKWHQFLAISRLWMIQLMSSSTYPYHP